MEEMNLIEAQWKTGEEPPKNCSYCMEPKSFLMLKPELFALKGALFININFTGAPLWSCLECFSIELDSMEVGSIMVNEYEH